MGIRNVKLSVGQYGTHVHKFIVRVGGHDFFVDRYVIHDG